MAKNASAGQTAEIHTAAWWKVRTAASMARRTRVVPRVTARSSGSAATARWKRHITPDVAYALVYTFTGDGGYPYAALMQGVRWHRASLPRGTCHGALSSPAPQPRPPQRT
jgi:hypothetical protein